LKLERTKRNNTALPKGLTKGKENLVLDFSLKISLNGMLDKNIQIKIGSENRVVQEETA
jgi:hypothetical protein